MEQTRERLMSFDGNLNFLLDSFMEVSNLLGKKLKKKKRKIVLLYTQKKCHERNFTQFLKGNMCFHRIFRRPLYSLFLQTSKRVRKNKERESRHSCSDEMQQSMQCAFMVIFLSWFVWANLWRNIQS
jgi:hypothetical protein